MSDKLAKTSFSETEARQLLVRAAELQSEKRLAVSTALTIHDIEQAGREVGIQPESLRQAATELGLQPEEGNLDAIREYDHAIVIGRTVSGQWDDTKVDRLLSAVRSEFAVQGHLERSDQAILWTSGPEASRKVSLSIEGLGDETRIRLVQDIKELHKTGTYLVGGSGMLIGIGAATIAGFIAGDIGQQILFTIFGTSIAGLGYGVFFGARLYRWYLRKLASPMVVRIQQLADELERCLPHSQDAEPERCLPAPDDEHET